MNNNNVYRFGQWNKDPEQIKTWRRVDYLINNQELYFDRNHIDLLQPMHSRKAVFVKMVLYALFDLTKKNTKDSFNITEIFNTVTKNKPMYKLLIKLKADKVLERINDRNYAKSNGSYNHNEKLNNTRKKFLEKLNKSDKAQYHDIYYAIAILFGIFINHKNISKSQTYNEFEGEDIKVYSKGYYLNQDGMRLMQKFQEDKYLL